MSKWPINGLYRRENYFFVHPGTLGRSTLPPKLGPQIAYGSIGRVGGGGGLVSLYWMGVEDIRWCEGGNASISPKLLAASKCVLYTVKCILYSVHCNMYKNVQFDTPNITPVECLKFDAIYG